MRVAALNAQSNMIGIFCPYVPVELIEAAGFRSRLLSGFESDQPDSDLPANLCPYIRRCSSFLKSDRARDELIGVIVSDSCSPMLRLWDFLETQKNTFPLQAFLRIPRLNNQSAVNLYSYELTQLVSDLASISGNSIGLEDMLQAIERCNHTRSLQQALYGHMLTGLFPHLALRLSTLMGTDDMDRDRLNCRLAELLEEVEKKDITIRPVAGPRLLVTGSHFIGNELLKILECHGAVIVELDTCSIDRMNTQTININAQDPVTALAEGYLNRPPCPRMRSGREQIVRVERLANEGKYDGVIYILMKSCTLYTYTVPLWRQVVCKTNTPMLVLEVEDAEWSSPRTITRLEAFLESFQ